MHSLFFGVISLPLSLLCVSFFSDPATTEIYTLSLHDALPIFTGAAFFDGWHLTHGKHGDCNVQPGGLDRKSTRLNSSHGYISYAVFCLKKKNNDLDRNSRSAPHFSRVIERGVPTHAARRCAEI